MSRSIDQRIVEMQFDNAQFERGIEQSVNSLNNLDKTIDNLGRGNDSNVFDRLGNIFTGIDSKFGNTAAALTTAMSSQLSSAATQIEYRFSALQVAMVQIISNLTNQLYSFVNNAVHTVTNKIVQGGINRAMNIENAHFMLQGLIDDENEVQAIMQDAKDSVDGTAYAYDSAAKAASQFAATGMRSGKEMQTALKGITGIAATTNSAYDDISRIFTTVAGNGRLMGDQLLQLSSRGLNVAASLSKYFKDVSNGSVEASDKVSKSVKSLVKKYGSNEAAIRDMVSKGKISFDIFSEAMGTTFGEHAKKANETFTGALSNIGAALARTGEMFVAPLIEQNGVLVKLFNAIRVKVNEVNAALKPFATMVTDKAKKIIDDITKWVEDINLDSIVEKIKKVWEIAKVVYSGLSNIFKGLQTIINPITTAIRDVWHSLSIGSEVVLDAAKSFEEYTKALKLNYTEQSKLIASVKSVLSTIKKLIEFLIARFNELEPTLSEIWRGLKLGITIIGQVISEIWKWITSIKGMDVSFASNSEKLKKWVDNLEEAVKEGHIVSKTFDKIKESLSRTFDGLGDKLSEIWEKIKDFFEKFKEALKIGFSKISFSGFLNALSQLAGGIAYFFANTVIPNIPKLGSMIISGIHKLGEELNNFIKSAGYRDLKAFLESFVVLGFFNSLRRLIEGFSLFNKSIFTGIDKWTLIGSKINSVLWSAKVGIDKFVAATQAKVIKDIAVALAILAGSLFVLSMINPDALAAPFAVLSAFLMELTMALTAILSTSQSMKILDPRSGGIFSTLLNSINSLAYQVKSVASIIATVTSIAFAIMTLSVALATLAKADPWMLAEALVVISAVMWEIFGLIAAMKAAKLGAVAIAAADAFKQFAIAFGIIALSIKLLSTLEPEQLVMGMTGLTAAMLLLILPMKEFYELTKNAADFTLALKAIRQIAVSLALMAGVIWLFGSMDILKLVQGIAGVTVVCSGLIVMLKELSKIPSAELGKIARQFLGMSVAILIIAGAVKMIGDLPLANMIVSLITIGGLIAALVMAAKQLDTLNSAGGAAVFLGLSVGLIFIAEAIKKVGSLSVETIVKGLLTLAIAITGLVIAATFLGTAAGPLAAFGAALLLVGAGIAAVGAGIWLLGSGLLMIYAAFMGLIGVLTTAPSLVVTGIATLIKAVAQGLYESADIIGKAIVGIIRVCCEAIFDSIGVVVETIVTFCEKTLEMLVEHGPKLVSLLLDFVIILINGLSEKIPELIPAINNFIDKLWGSIREATGGDASIVKILGFLTGITAIITILGTFGAAGIGLALNGLKIIAIVIAGLIAIMMIVGTISALPGVNWLINKGGDLLEALGVAIGRFIGGIVGGIGLGISNQFPKICENIQNGLDKLNLDSNTIDGIKNLSEAMLLITADNLLESLTRFFTGKNSFEEFGKAIESFGPHFAAFYESIKSIDDTDKIKVVCESLKLLCEAASSIPDSGESLKSFFFGDHDISEFGRKLVSFGPHFVQFCDIVKNVDSSGVKPVSEALVALCEAAKKIPDRGESLKSFFLGDHDISEFGRKLVSFGPHFAEFCAAVTGIDTSGVDATADALLTMANVAKEMPDDGKGLQRLFGGKQDLSSFGQKIAVFGNYFKKFVDTIGMVGPDTINASANCFKIMVDAAKTLDEHYSIFDKLVGGKFSSLSTFGKEMAAFAPYFKEFIKGLGDYSVDKAKAACDIVDQFCQMAVSLSGIETTSINLTALGYQMESIGSSLNTFAEVVSSIDESKLEMAVTTLRTLVRIARDIASIESNKFDEFVTKMSAIGTTGIQGIIDSLNESKTSVPDAIVEAVDEYIIKIEEQIDRVNSIIITNVRSGLAQWTFKNIAKQNVLGGLETGLKDSTEINNIKIASTKAGEAAATGMKTRLSRYSGKSIAMDFINGLVIGLNGASGRSALGRAATSVGNVVLTYLRKVFDSHSPSREAMKIGGDVDNGLAIGMDRLSGVVRESAKNVGDETLNSMRDSISRLNDGLFDDDFRPVISPILDLSDVKSRAGDINGLFGDKQFKMATDINGMMNSYADAQRLAKSFTLDDGRMVQAITDLRRDVNNMGMQMNNLQVVMDSGALVGQIARPMDAALGGRMIRREREA